MENLQTSVYVVIIDTRIHDLREYIENDGVKFFHSHWNENVVHLQSFLYHWLWWEFTVKKYTVYIPGHRVLLRVDCFLRVVYSNNEKWDGKGILCNE